MKIKILITVGLLSAALAYGAIERIGMSRTFFVWVGGDGIGGKSSILEVWKDEETGCRYMIVTNLRGGAAIQKLEAGKKEL